MDFLKRLFGQKSSDGDAHQSNTVTIHPTDNPVPSGKFRFIALDVETANSSNGSICQIGLACVEGDGSILRYATFVRPEEEFDQFNIDLHGIDQRKVHDAPIFPDVLKDLSPLLADHAIIQHSNFDKGAFAAACRKYSLPEPPWTWLDSVQIARRAWPELRGNGGHGLASLKTFLSIDFNHHDAAEDARAAALVVLRAEAATGSDLHKLSAPAPRRNYPKIIAMDGNIDGPLSGQVAVFTGSLSISRTEAASLSAQAGMTVAANVTKKTTVLVVGDQDLSILAGHEKSAKHRKAEELVSSGQSIRIIGESEFRSLIGAAPAQKSKPAHRPLTKDKVWVSAKQSILAWSGEDYAPLMKDVHSISALLMNTLKAGEISYKDTVFIGQDTEQIADALRDYADEAELEDFSDETVKGLQQLADIMEEIDDQIGEMIISKAEAARQNR